MPSAPSVTDEFVFIFLQPVMYFVGYFFVVFQMCVSIFASLQYTVCTVQYVLYSMYCTVCTVQYYQGIKEKFAQKTDSFDCTYYNLNTVQIFQHKLFIYNYVEFFLTLKMSKRSSKRWIRLSLHYFG